MPGRSDTFAEPPHRRRWSGPDLVRTGPCARQPLFTRCSW